MRKHSELSNQTSCLNKASDNEMIFVLRGHDITAPSVIRYWVHQRVRIGKNDIDDPQIQEALACANIMENERG